MSRSTILKLPTPFFVLVVLAIGIGTMVGCGDDSAQDAATAEQAAPPARTATAVPAGKGSPAPDFTLRRLDGGELQLSSLRGKAVIVDFWDTWCPPCRKAMPHLQELSETYSDDLVVVGVAFGREGEAKVRSYIKDNGLTFEMVLFNNDPGLIRAFGGLQSIPTTFLIDADGIIREKWVGGFGKETYEKGIRTVLGS